MCAECRKSRGNGGTNDVLLVFTSTFSLVNNRLSPKLSTIIRTNPPTHPPTTHPNKHTHTHTHAETCCHSHLQRHRASCEGSDGCDRRCHNHDVSAIAAVFFEGRTRTPALRQSTVTRKKKGRQSIATSKTPYPFGSPNVMMIEIWKAPARHIESRSNHSWVCSPPSSSLSTESRVCHWCACVGLKVPSLRGFWISFSGWLMPLSQPLSVFSISSWLMECTRKNPSRCFHI